MSDVSSNKQAVLEFYDLAFNKNKPEEAAERYLGDVYIQHNPAVRRDGAAAFIGFVRGFRSQFPGLRFEVKRAIAEGDLVAVHSHLKVSADDRGTAVMDFFRLENGRIVEHWDALQPVPEDSANANTMF